MENRKKSIEAENEGLNLNAMVYKTNLTTGNTPLHLACQQGDFQLVKRIATENPETIHLFINAKNKDNKTPYEISEELNVWHGKMGSIPSFEHCLIMDYITGLTR